MFLYYGKPGVQRFAAPKYFAENNAETARSDEVLL